MELGEIMMDMNQVWNAGLYDHKLDFVSEYGKDVVRLLDPREGEHILDLGCGTGDLAFEIARSGASVVGIDLSSEMIEQAKRKYPGITFHVKNGESFSFGGEKFDAVFSNAAMHWMRNASGAIRSIHDVLRDGGRFVTEFGGKGNVQRVVEAITQVLAEADIDAGPLNPWYFPSIGEYSSLLEEHGFEVEYAVHFDRPTIMKDGEQGLFHWIEAFGGTFFESMSTERKQATVEKIADRLRSVLYQDGAWFIDYRRIRVKAIKL